MSDYHLNKLKFHDQSSVYFFYYLLLYFLLVPHNCYNCILCIVRFTEFHIKEFLSEKYITLKLQRATKYQVNFLANSNKDEKGRKHQPLR